MTPEDGKGPHRHSAHEERFLDYAYGQGSGGFMPGQPDHNRNLILKEKQERPSIDSDDLKSAAALLQKTQGERGEERQKKNKEDPTTATTAAPTGDATTTTTGAATTTADDGGAEDVDTGGDDAAAGGDAAADAEADGCPGASANDTEWQALSDPTECLNEVACPDADSPEGDWSGLARTVTLHCLKPIECSPYSDEKEWEKLSSKPTIKKHCTLELDAIASGTLLNDAFFTCQDTSVQGVTCPAMPSAVQQECGVLKHEVTKRYFCPSSCRSCNFMLQANGTHDGKKYCVAEHPQAAAWCLDFEEPSSFQMIFKGIEGDATFWSFASRKDEMCLQDIPMEANETDVIEHTLQGAMDIAGDKNPTIRWKEEEYEELPKSLHHFFSPCLDGSSELGKYQEWELIHIPATGMYQLKNKGSEDCLTQETLEDKSLTMSTGQCAQQAAEGASIPAGLGKQMFKIKTAERSFIIKNPSQDCVGVDSDGTIIGKNCMKAPHIEKQQWMFLPGPGCLKMPDLSAAEDSAEDKRYCYYQLYQPDLGQCLVVREKEVAEGEEEPEEPENIMKMEQCIKDYPLKDDQYQTPGEPVPRLADQWLEETRRRDQFWLVERRSTKSAQEGTGEQMAFAWMKPDGTAVCLSVPTGASPPSPFKVGPCTAAELSRELEVSAYRPGTESQVPTETTTTNNGDGEGP